MPLLEADTPTSAPAFSPSLVDGELLAVDPDTLLLDPELERIFGAERYTPAELDELARTIEEEGQQQPALCYPDPDLGGLVIFDGRERRRAVQRARANGSALSLSVRVLDIDKASAFRRAALANIQRKGFTASQWCGIIAATREKFGWKGKKHTLAVASFLGVDKATVTEYERYSAECPDDVKAKVERGDWSITTALAVVAHVDEPGMRLAVAEAAERRAVVEEVEASEHADAERVETLPVVDDASALDPEVLEAAAKKKRGIAKKAVRPQAEIDAQYERVQAARKRAGAAPASPARVKERHVAAAARETPGAQSHARAWKMSDCVEFFGLIESAAAGYPQSMLVFASAVRKRAAGEITDAELKRSWDEIADEAFEEKQPFVIAAELATAKKKAATAIVPVAKKKTAAAKSPVKKPATKPAKPAKSAAVAKKSATKSVTKSAAGKK